MRISGRITFRPPPEDLSGAVVHVRLLDTTMADAPSVTISEVALSGSGLGARADRASGTRYELSAPDLSPSRCYEIAVHVDIGDTGEVSVGDYLNTASHPVPADHRSAVVDVEVRRI